MTLDQTVEAFRQLEGAIGDEPAFAQAVVDLVMEISHDLGPAWNQPMERIERELERMRLLVQSRSDGS